MTREEWEAKQNASKKQFKYVSQGTPGQVKKVEVSEEEEMTPDVESEEPLSEKIKEATLDYSSWLEKKGVKDKSALSKIDVDSKIFKQYMAENPDNNFSVDVIASIKKIK